MSEEGEIWRAFKESTRERRNLFVDDFRNTHLKKLQEKYSVTEFNTNSFRIKNEDGQVIDYYPSSGKYHVHSSKFRGKIYMSAKCVEIIDREFKKIK